MREPIGAGAFFCSLEARRGAGVEKRQPDYQWSASLPGARKLPLHRLCPHPRLKRLPAGRYWPAVHGSTVMSVICFSSDETSVGASVTIEVLISAVAGDAAFPALRFLVIDTPTD